MESHRLALGVGDHVISRYMYARHIFDSTVLRITGRDTRLVGNWEPVPDWKDRGAELAAALDIPERELLRCREIADVLDLIRPCHGGVRELASQYGLFARVSGDS